MDDNSYCSYVYRFKDHHILKCLLLICEKAIRTLKTSQSSDLSRKAKSDVKRMFHCWYKFAPNRQLISGSPGHVADLILYNLKQCGVCEEWKAIYSL